MMEDIKTMMDDYGYITLRLPSTSPLCKSGTKAGKRRDNGFALDKTDARLALSFWPTDAVQAQVEDDGTMGGICFQP